MKLLGYKTWQRFDGVIDEAKEVCAKEVEGAVEKTLATLLKFLGVVVPSKRTIGSLAMLVTLSL
jgi:hypothetical protein